MLRVRFERPPSLFVHDLSMLSIVGDVVSIIAETIVGASSDRDNRRAVTSLR